MYGKLGAPKLSLVRPGTFRTFDEDRIHKTGIRQVKPVHLLKDTSIRDKIHIGAEYSL